MLLYMIIGVILLVILYIHRRHTMYLLKRGGIPGPEPNLIWGNKTKKGSFVANQKHFINKYGKVCGYYNGVKPVVLVADPELAKMILVKDFHKFSDRTDYNKKILPSYLCNGCLNIVGGIRWKKLRGLMSTAFTPRKLKAMNEMICDSIDTFLKKAKQIALTGQEVNIDVLTQRLVADITVRTSFGFNFDLQNDTQNKFLKGLQNVSRFKLNYYAMILDNVFPIFAYVIDPVRNFIATIGIKTGMSQLGYVWSVAAEMLAIRKKESTKRSNDLLQAMIESHLSEDHINNMTEEKLHISHVEECNDNDQAQISKSKRADLVLTEDEICINSVLFYMAGYDTTSSGIAYSMHFLVNYPEQQELIREEAQAVFEREGVFDYNTVKQLKHMECFINEVLRLYPPIISASSRECLEDYIYKDMVIPKGAMVCVCNHYLQNCPDYWPEPEKFDPGRFGPERKNDINSGAWLPFGIGPRNCLGINLAYYEMKLILAKLLLAYRLESGPNTERGSIESRFGYVTNAPKNGVWLRLIEI